MMARSPVLTLLAVILVAGNGHTQPTPADSNTTEWIRPEEVPARADELLRRVDEARPGPAAESSLAKIEKALPQLDRDLDASLKDAADAVERLAPPTDLQDRQNDLTSLAAPLVGWKDELNADATRIAAALDLIGRGKRIWSETEQRPETAAAGEVVVHRVESSLRALNEAEERLRSWGARVLPANDRVITHLAEVDASLERLSAAILTEREHLLSADRPPLWERGLGTEIRSELPRVPAELRAYAEGSAAYLRRNPRPLLVQGLLAVALMLGLARFSARVRERLAGAAASRAARLLDRPYSIGLLLALLTSPLFHPLAPRRLTQLLVVIALFPVARIVTHASERASIAAFAGLFLLLFLDRLGSALQALPTVAQATFLLLLALGIGLAFWLSRRARDEDIAWLDRAAVLAMLGLFLAVLADVGGWTNLGTLIGRAILAGAIAALYVYAATLSLAALLAYAMTSRAAARSRLFTRNAALLQRRTERAVRWAGVGLWLYMVATALGIRSTVFAALAAVLDAGVTVGTLSLSVRGVLAFVLMLMIAFFLARVVTAVLEEDVYPRTQLPRGAPYAITTLVRYALYSLGFLFALAAAGVPLDQVAIMLGGLGIGLGLGLQDLVRNFAAGLTLLFERRVHVEDVLELPGRGIFGRVLSIGMRASLVRTWNGAEVVVPNADLISDAVTNWTLTDRLCRVEVPVSVASGSDPESVIALLLDATRSGQHLLAEPAPQVLFKGFGKGSLDFVVQAWIDREYGESLPVTSELALALHRSLHAARIALP